MATNTNELNWSAFRYVSGEMTADELAAFELRLDDDQEARDAVVAAVKLMDAVATAEYRLPAPLTPVLQTARRLNRVETYLTVAVALAIAVVFWVSRSNDRKVAGVDSTRPSAASDADDGRSDVLSVWSELNSTVDRDDDSAPEVETVGADDAELEVPGWMIAALTPASPNGPDDSEDVQLEN